MDPVITERPEHQQRVIEEQQQLSDRLVKLAAFVTAPKFSGIPAEERDLLREQLTLMSKLQRVLDQRIQLFDKEITT